MNVRLERRMGFEVRRDAVEELVNGRMLYDALFSRWGLQGYPEGVEYRPADEVFAPASMASGDHAPGVLLHPAANYGTSFGEGSHPVRGVIAGPVTAHADGIHTAGKLMVWDAEWNAQIASAETSELSVGFTIDPDPTPGTAPADAPGAAEFGLGYVLVHRAIVWDHLAGVPEGNAGTAMVVLDARSRLATRVELAKMASMRLDSRPFHHDLGRWPPRADAAPAPKQDATMDPKILRLQTLLAAPRHDRKAIADAWVDIYGESTDPDMQAALLAMGSSPEPAAPAPAAPVAPIADAEEEPAKEDPDAEEEEPTGDRADRRLAYADAYSLAKLTHGASFIGRGDDGCRADGKPWSLDQLRMAVVEKTDAKTAARIDRLDAKVRAPALGLAFEQARDVIDARAQTGPALAAAIADARSSGVQTTVTDAITEIGARLDSLTTNAASHTYGAAARQTPPPAR